MGVSKNNCTPKSSILIGFSIINYPFWGTPIFGNTHICVGQLRIAKNAQCKVPTSSTSPLSKRSKINPSSSCGWWSAAPSCSPLWKVTLHETNIAAKNRPSQKESIVFQQSIFRCKLFVSGRVPPRKWTNVTWKVDHFKRLVFKPAFLKGYLPGLGEYPKLQKTCYLLTDSYQPFVKGLGFQRNLKWASICSVLSGHTVLSFLAKWNNISPT